MLRANNTHLVCNRYHPFELSQSMACVQMCRNVHVATCSQVGCLQKQKQCHRWQGVGSDSSLRGSDDSHAKPAWAGHNRRQPPITNHRYTQSMPVDLTSKLLPPVVAIEWQMQHTQPVVPPLVTSTQDNTNFGLTMY